MSEANTCLEIFTDGACSGNPGPAGIGVVLKKDGKTIKEISRSIETATNNIAEYFAVIYGLQEALLLKADRVILHTDSELIFKQVAGSYKVKHANIKPLFDLVRHLAGGFQDLTFKHILRGQNAEADKLAKNSIKKEQAKVVALEFNFGEESPSSKG